MRLLAIDTSTDTLSIAVRHGAHLWHREQAGGAQSSRVLLPEILRLLKQADLSLATLEAIIYGCGPGAFTGLRTTCAVAQGLAWGRNLPALPVDSLTALAAAAARLQGLDRVVAVLDARMQEVYAAPLRWQADASLAGGGVWLLEDEIRVLPPQALQVPQGYALVGNAFIAYPELQTHWAARGHAVVHAVPQARDMLAVAPALMERGAMQTAQQIAPVYVRNKVALTTQEREQAKLQRDA
ncbi:hypothetical protein AAV94_09390 [Lampropedia cohaerens]|uniref:Gcp-like domain-containing protein n=1 Tax=Lampropedia cohaerens TaxID=1610491 RepID=A0A0U1PYR4_9BURK|nr:tRNA (adenosine(37)-N6)-threonylcarbamoyltransferase complex dimerization subunit type 1 TsaB [Lampropedia cohaerens]KKW67616.1 hypothetical protein AAV94_09390 [Lampropedia cohaerens]